MLRNLLQTADGQDTEDRLARSRDRQSAQGSTNVLLIVIDDLNDWVGCLEGHPEAKTPHIDALARRGTLFTNAHCQAPLCGPSRASLLSGRYPHTTGVYQQPRGPGLVQDEKFIHGHLLPQYFARHGYETLAAGKITHGYPLDLAFEQSGSSGNSGPKPPQRFHFEPPDVPWSGTQTDWGVFPRDGEPMPDDITADWAIEQLHSSHDRPFFLAVGFHRPHVPFYARRRWFDLHPLDEVTLPVIRDDDLDDVPAIGRLVHEVPAFPQLGWLRQNDNEQLRRCTQGYLACTSYVDHQAGRVLAALADSPYAENTLIVLVSDHGYHLGEKSRVSKHGLWEEATRVPLIVVRPGEQDAGRRCGQPVGLIDLYPTLLDLCGLPPQPANEGRSLRPLLSDPEGDWRDAIITTYARGCHTLRSNRYRYIRYEDGSEELYDHQSDPNEWTNLASDPNSADVLEQFRKQLPSADADYHPSTSPAPVNAWFENHYRRNGVGG